jgi:8-oxo-dGTP pyrophosphatase MutT (NUDIX family)/glutathione synthase/RimK-type ligase-like ATP-grasp enzyme
MTAAAFTQTGPGPVCVVTTRQDITADRVLISLTAAGADVLRLDLADWPSVRLDATCAGAAGWTGTLTVSGRTVRLEKITTVWWWHPAPAVVHAGRTPAEAEWVSREATAGLAGVLAALDCRHVNHPASTYAAQSKPDVLAQAARCGLRVPDSWIGNHPPGAQGFATQGAGGTVIKSISQPVVQESGRRSTLFTRPVDPGQLDETVSITAHHLQHQVIKRFEVRLVVVGAKMLAARIDAHSPAARHDFRADYPSLTYSVADVPEEVRSGVRRLMAHYGLHYAALDLLVDETGTWWLVDLNPAGQWGWLQEHLPDLDIAGAMARLLTARPHSHSGQPGPNAGDRGCTTPSAFHSTAPTGDTTVAHRDTSWTEPGHRRIGALWLIVDAEDRALVVQPSYRQAGRYQLVGGGAAADEAPHLAAIREGWEETGLRMVPDTLLLADYIPRNEETGSAEGLNLVFLHRFGRGDEITLNAGSNTPDEEPELLDFKWLRADELDEHCTPGQADRIRAAMAAAADPSKRGFRFQGRPIAHDAAA